MRPSITRTFAAPFPVSFFSEKRGIVKDALIRRFTQSAEIGGRLVFERCSTTGPARNDPLRPVAVLEKAVVSSKTGRRYGDLR
jgi:hypothetical protein